MYTKPNVLATYAAYNGSKGVGGDWGLWSESSNPIEKTPH